MDSVNNILQEGDDLETLIKKRQRMRDYSAEKTDKQITASSK